MIDMNNQLIARRYRLVKQVGTGNMSTVYECMDTLRGNKTVALKLLNTTQDDDLILEVFRRETKALARLEHDNIIQILDHGNSTERECPYLVFEYIPRTLLDEIKAHKNDENLYWCWPLMRQMANALVYAHSQSIIHRDIKPTNILITPDGKPKLTDFGISLLKYEIGTGVTVSSFYSIGYAAPEQRNGNMVTEQSDIYSLGCVFYHMLSGHTPPNDGITPEHIETLKKVPVSVRKILKEMLAPDIKDRFESAIHLYRRLELTKNLEYLPDVYFLITDRARRDLLNLSLIKHTHIEEAQEFLLEEFGGNNPKELQFLLETKGNIRVITDTIILKCVKHENLPIFVIIEIETPYQPRLERQRNSGLTLRYLWQFITSYDSNDLRANNYPALSETLNIIITQLNTHNRSQQTARDRRVERKDFINVWEKVLNFQRVKLNATPKLRYKSILKQHNTLSFELTAPAPDNLPWEDSDPMAIIPSGEERQRPLNIGLLISVNGKYVQVAWEPGDIQDSFNSPNDLPPNGFITIYQQQAQSLLERQDAALRSLQSGSTLNPRLPEILLNPSSALFDVVDDEIQFFQPDLADDKKKAVRQALAAHDIFLLQGPPGTGKTTTLAEIILQILKLKPDARILVSSQSNIAVDHVLSRVKELRGTDPTEIVRIGRPDKINLGAKEWTLEQRRKSWREQVLERTDLIIKELKSQSQELQKQKKAAKNLSPEQINDLQGCKDYLESIQLNVDELNDIISHINIPGYLKIDLDQLLSCDVTLLPSQIQGKIVKLQQNIQEIKDVHDLVRSYLPQSVKYQAQPSIAEEQQYLLSLTNNLLSTEDNYDNNSREAKLLDLVNKWRKIFGKQDDFAAPIFERANILAATCIITGNRHLKSQEFDWAIIDEAGRATAPELLVPLVRARRSIIVGDERQLPPMIDEDLSAEDLAQIGATKVSLAESLFASLVSQADIERDVYVQMLTVQHRMHPAIGRLISQVFYDGRLTHGVSEDEREHGIDWLSKSVIWFSTSPLSKRFETQREQGFYNLVEVQQIESLLHRMENTSRSLNLSKSVGVITPYNAQILELQNQIEPDNSYWKALKIEIATVDAFQGRDCDIVLYSTVRSNKDANLGFLRDRRRLNVALSRARQLLIIVGDIFTLEKGKAGPEGNPYQELVKYMHDHPEDCLIENLKEQHNE